MCVVCSNVVLTKAWEMGIWLRPPAHMAPVYFALIIKFIVSEFSTSILLHLNLEPECYVHIFTAYFCNTCS